MDVRNLKTFLKVSELNNFTKAALMLGYSQSAVTVQMQQLETELGLPLFDRIGKNIKLTQYGVNFVDYASKVIEAMERAENFAVESKQMKGTIHLGIVDSILNTVFISILPEFNRRFPNINISISVGSAREIEAKMRSNDLDIAYMLDYKVPRKEWVRVREENEPIIFVTNPDNALASKETVKFEEIINEKLILMPIGEGYRYLFDDELAARNLYATPSIEIANTETILKLIKEANYVTMLPVFMVRDDIKKGLLKKINVEDCELSQWSQLTYLKGKAVTPLLQVFIDTLDELLPPIEK
ncbi:MAG: LysR family transcriptional regulator [Clostridia bacterium]|nr:LysR family transcriptional regulator [Clostridia bacterium]